MESTVRSHGAFSSFSERIDDALEPVCVGLAEGISRSSRSGMERPLDLVEVDDPDSTPPVSEVLFGSRSGALLDKPDGHGVVCKVVHGAEAIDEANRDYYGSADPDAFGLAPKE